jgi:phosphoglucosamine mutase
VREVRADIGIALDGDADRVIIVDEKGQVVDGDQLMALIGGLAPPREPAAAGGGMVATVMSNLGLERYLAGAADAGAHQGRRPLCGRAHAQGRLQCRRRAVRPYHPVSISRPPATA